MLDEETEIDSAIEVRVLADNYCLIYKKEGNKEKKDVINVLCIYIYILIVFIRLYQCHLQRTCVLLLEIFYQSFIISVRLRHHIVNAI